MMTTIENEVVRASLYITLTRLGLSREMYMNWNYLPDGFAPYIGDTRWSR